jgi:hypothetical protein
MSDVNLRSFVLCILQKLLYSICSQQPLLTVNAHVFYINQETKKSWVNVTESAVPVSFFYDANRGMYRIISVDGTQVGPRLIEIFPRELYPFPLMNLS